MYRCNTHNKIIKFRNRHVSLNSKIQGVQSFPKFVTSSQMHSVQLYFHKYNTNSKFALLQNISYQGFYARDFFLQKFHGLHKYHIYMS